MPDERDFEDIMVVLEKMQNPSIQFDLDCAFSPVPMPIDSPLSATAEKVTMLALSVGIEPKSTN